MATNGKTLDLSALENWLWEAACVVGGPLDAPKFKDYMRGEGAEQEAMCL